jgi:hypothetical protein
MIFRHPHIRSLLPILLFTLILAPASAAAQLTFGGIAWGTPADSAAAAIQRAGYVPRGQDQDGDRVFGDAAGVDLVTMFDSAGLVGVELEWSRPVDALPARFAVLADSLRRAFGPPDDASEDGEEPAMEWARDGVHVWLFLFPRGGGRDSMLSLRYEGPGWEAEFERRNDAERERDAYEEENGRADTTAYGDWLRVYSDGRDFTRVDTARFTRLGDRLYRARFLDAWFQRRRLENGMMYNGAITEVELDCRRMTTRLLRTIPLYSHRALLAIDGEAWLLPMPNANHHRAVTAACEVLGRQP